jgi:hypothetical protein
MSTLYADRGFIDINGVEVLDVESVSVKVSDGTKHVPTMTRNRRFNGTVKGNREVSCNFAVAVQNTLGSPKIEMIDYQNNNVNLTFQHGADIYTLVNMDFVDVDQSASGVGTEGKKSFNTIFLDIIEQTGNSALFPTSLSSILASSG